ncbi:MAG: hypothetical protein ABJF23_08660 [Bryobacteraceae bacterium]
MRRQNENELPVPTEEFTSFDAADWDRKIASDSQSGKLSKLAAPAVEDHEAGRSIEL